MLFGEFRLFLRSHGIDQQTFCRATGFPSSTLESIRHASCPKGSTVDRLRSAMTAWPKVEERHAPAPFERIRVLGIHRGPAPRSTVSAPQRAVPRDPCWRCGVRGDVGCKHQRPEAHL